jgi:hypothetical protein
MTEFLASTTKIREKNYVTIRDAVKRVSYTTDYIGKLARERVVDAVRKGRVWYVDLDSLKLFELKAKAERKKTQEALSIERKLERIKARLPSYNVEDRIQDRSKKYLALLETTAVTACLILTLTLSAAAKEGGIKFSDFGIAAVSAPFRPQSAAIWPEFSKLKDWFWLFKSEPIRETKIVRGMETTPTVSSEGRVLSQTLEIPKLDKDKKLLHISTKYQENVGGGFSDEVEVVFFDSRKGVIKPIFVNSRGEEMEFVINEDGPDL